jgi:hypothetical protein
LGAVGVDIAVKLLQEFSPKYRVGLFCYNKKQGKISSRSLVFTLMHL